MRTNTPLESFLGFMKLENDANSMSAQDIEMQEVEELTLSNDDEFKLCVQMFGAPMRLIDCKDFQ